MSWSPETGPRSAGPAAVFRDDEADGDVSGGQRLSRITQGLSRSAHSRQSHFPFLMSRISLCHCAQVNTSTAPERLRESLTNTDESAWATSTHPPLAPLALLLRQIKVESRFG